ncbi:MAG: hypothetical protein AAF318_15655 [Pseudomonadota bacterium]
MARTPRLYLAPLVGAFALAALPATAQVVPGNTVNIQQAPGTNSTFRVEQVPATRPSDPRPAAAVTTVPGTRTQAVAPADPASANMDRVFLDTGVSDVRVNELLTVATMNQSPESDCPSNQYIYERDRPKWLFQTGRLLQAVREGATVRISFSCMNGVQSINAMQFLSPPGAQPVASLPRRNDAVALPVVQSAVPAGVIPRPTNASAGRNLSREERVRLIPLP